MLICFQMTNFSTWLESELARRKMPPGVLAKKMHKNAGTVSRLLNGERKPDMKTLNAIIEALDIPGDIVYRAAGALIPKLEISDNARRVDGALTGIPEHEQESAIDAALSLFNSWKNLLNQGGVDEKKRVSKISKQNGHS